MSTGAKLSTMSLDAMMASIEYELEYYSQLGSGDDVESTGAACAAEGDCIPEPLVPSSGLSITDAAAAVSDEEIAILLSLDKSVVAVRLKTRANLMLFTIPQLRKINQLLCERNSIRFKVFQTKSEWVDKTWRMLCPVSSEDTNRSSFTRNQPSAVSSKPSTPVKLSSLSNPITDLITSSEIVNSPFADSAATPPPTRSSISLNFQTTAASFNSPRAIGKASRKFATNSPLLQQSPQPAFTRPNTTNESSASPFRNPLLFRALSNSPSSKRTSGSGLGNSGSSGIATTSGLGAAAPVSAIALGRSINWKPTASHYSSMAKFTRQIPGLFHVFHDFGIYVHSESKYAQRGSGRGMGISLFLTKPVCEYFAQNNHNNHNNNNISPPKKKGKHHGSECRFLLKLFVQMESANPLLESLFGAPAGTIVTVKIGDAFKFVHTSSGNEIIDLTSFLMESLEAVSETATEFNGTVMDISFVFPTPQNTAPIHTLLVGMKKLNSREAMIKLCENHLVSQGLTGTEKANQSIYIPSFWSFSILSKEMQQLGFDIPEFERYLVQKSQPIIQHHNQDHHLWRSRTSMMEEDIQHGDVVVSFICPLTLRRIVIPGKGKYCTHLQNFDMETFIEFSKQLQQWKCIICCKRIECTDLVFDAKTLCLSTKYKGRDKCVLRPDGSDVEYCVQGSVGALGEDDDDNDAAGGGKKELSDDDEDDSMDFTLSQIKLE
ncbi:hypothetical protein BDR26DRAFT_381109 [Obelidium mucronatum]|nr:hypothetical protein BDR26DRAFT_381109 [Obelidium mucronatum]